MTMLSSFGALKRRLRTTLRIEKEPQATADDFLRGSVRAWEQHDRDRAFNIVRRGLRFHPKSEALHLNHLQMLIVDHSRAGAIGAAQVALSLPPTQPGLLDAACHILNTANAPADTLRRAARILATTEIGLTDSGVIHRDQLLRLAGDAEGAAALLAKAIAATPINEDLVRALADSAVRHGLSAADSEILHRAAASSALSPRCRAEMTLALEIMGIDDGPIHGPSAVTEKIFAHLIRHAPPPAARPDGPVVVLSWTLARGGAERLAAMTVARLRDRLHPRRVILALMTCSDQDGTDFYLPLTRLSEADVLVQRDMGPVEAPLRWLEMPNAYQWLVTILREIRPAAIVTNLEVPNMIGGLAAVMTGVPRIVLGTYNMRPSDFIDNADYCRRMQVAQRALLARPEVRLTSLSATCLQDYGDWLGTGIDRRMGIVPSGFEIDAFGDAGSAADRRAARDALGLDAHAPVTGAVMRVTAVKAPLLWIDVAAAVLAKRPDARFVIIGDGDLLETMKQAATARNLDHAIRFTGAVQDAYSLLPALDVFLLTSESEGLPNAVVEAQLSGVPVVARRVGAVGDAMIPGRTGILVDAPSPAALAGAVLAFLDDEVGRRDAGAAGRAFARSAFTIDARIDRLLALIDDGESDAARGVPCRPGLRMQEQADA